MMSMHYLAVAAILMIGMSALVSRRNLIKIIMSLHVMGSAVNLFLVSLGYREGSIAPIFTNAPSLQMVMPAPQALTLTSIVINIAVVALMLSFAILIYQHYGSLDPRRRRLSG
ncbi:MAG: cation:proton antiporter subunit C [Candidatus Aenigmarchaeota archaeon]|nr:cation:proton antiporter subunit C [Candidatus Aenigmarchaeota archaeon]